MKTIHVIAAALAGAALLALPDGPAHADPPEPSDYESVIVAISPPTNSIQPRLIGDGSVIELMVTAGTDVTVSGYQSRAVPPLPARRDRHREPPRPDDISEPQSER